MLDTEGKKAGFTVTIIELAECLDRNEVECKTTEATAALCGLLALAMHSSVENIDLKAIGPLNQH